MRRSGAFLQKLTACLTIAVLVCTQSAMAVPDGSDRRVIRQRAARADLSPHDIYIPETYGRVIERYQAPAGSSQSADRPIVIHIQDLHTQPEAQRHLAEIIAHLDDEYRVDLVGSEGASGLIDVSAMADFSVGEARDRAAHVLLESGELTGEEYLAITERPDLSLWGIEDIDPYFEHLSRFGEAMPGENLESRYLIADIQDVLQELQRKLYDKHLWRLEKKHQDYQDGQVSLDDYLRYLDYYLRKFDISFSSVAPTVARWGEAQRLEGGLDEPAAEEQAVSLARHLVRVLLASGEAAAAERVEHEAEQFAFGARSLTWFSTWVTGFAARWVPRDQRAQWAAAWDMAEYASLVEEIDGTQFYEELRELKVVVQDALFRSDDQRELRDLSARAEFLEDFFSLMVTNEQLARYLASPSGFRLHEFQNFVNAWSERYRFADGSAWDAAQLDDHLGKLERFYEAIGARDVAMIRNLSKAMQRRQAQVVVLVTGGFHTQNLAQLLKDEGISYLIVSPVTSGDLDHERYHDLLRGRHASPGELLSYAPYALRPPMASAANPQFVARAARSGHQTLGVLAAPLLAAFTIAGLVLESSGVLGLGDVAAALSEAGIPADAGVALGETSDAFIVSQADEAIEVGKAFGDLGEHFGAVPDTMVALAPSAAFATNVSTPPSARVPIPASRVPSDRPTMFRRLAAAIAAVAGNLAAETVDADRLLVQATPVGQAVPGAALTLVIDPELVLQQAGPAPELLSDLVARGRQVYILDRGAAAQRVRELYGRNVDDDLFMRPERMAELQADRGFDVMYMRPQPTVNRYIVWESLDHAMTVFEKTGVFSIEAVSASSLLEQLTPELADAIRSGV